MFAKVSKLSAPIAGAILLVSAGFVSTASAAPQAAGLQFQVPASELVVKVDHRGRRGGWDRHDRRDWRRHTMGPRQIRRSLRHRGFHRIRIIDRRGPMFIVNAKGWNGIPMRLVVDSRTADIVRSRPRHGGWGWQNRW
ncbi:hypothetical protein [Roseibium sp.]|uniref:hypothetical protein n=1 Tax=Roseibium sp. TaxID=1936156 RepID=UPI003D0A22BA